MHYIADNASGGMLRCELETSLDFKSHYAKSKHYSCHMDEDLQKEQFCSLS